LIDGARMKLRAAILSAFVFSISASAKPADDFARYPARVFTGPLRFPTEDDWPAPSWRETSAERINFGGHFSLVGIPCGTACGNFLLVDRRTGKMSRIPEGPEGLDYESVETRANSNLLKILWVSAKFDGSGDTFPPCYRQNFVWTGARFRPLSKPIMAKCPPDVPGR
jgi:hypothetical protein